MNANQNLHAHVVTHSSDCDGALTREYVRTQTVEEKADEFGEIHFRDRMAGLVVNTFSILYSGNLHVYRNGEGGEVTLVWSEQTEEGGINTTVTFCDSECNPEYEAYRDHRAESMNY